MKAKRLLFLVMVICLASGVRAQFYDGPDDIYFYLREYENGKAIEKEDQYVFIFNFDGKKAAFLNHNIWEKITDVQAHLQQNPDYYAEKVETTKYDMEYVSSSYGICYKQEYTTTNYIPNWMGVNQAFTHRCKATYEFSSDRSKLTLYEVDNTHMANGTPTTHNDKFVLKKVDKSYFKVGRSRTPSGTLYE